MLKGYTVSSAKHTEVTPVAVQIVTEEEEYIELFWNREVEVMTKHFMEIGVRLGWKVQRRHQRYIQSVGEYYIYAENECRGRISSSIRRNNRRRGVTEEESY